MTKETFWSIVENTYVNQSYIFYFDHDKELATKVLKQYEDQFDPCVEWLSEMKVTGTPLRESTYSLKHLASQEIGYIPVGIFNAALVHLGIPFRTDGSYVFPCISVTSIKEKRGLVR